MAETKARKSKPLPDAKQSVAELPQVGVPENTVRIGDDMREIKPTKLRYQRNRTAAFYKMIDTWPLAELLAMDEGAFGDDRDGDKCVMDWLIAVFDDEDFVVKHYDEMDTAFIEQVLAIFRRVNRIDEKEDKLKNLTLGRKEG